MASGTWAVDAAGNWSLASNWASSAIADAATFTANFTNNITTARTVTLDTTRTIGNLTFSDAGASGSAWTLAGSNALTLDNGGAAPVIDVITGTTISVPLFGTAGFTTSGAGQLSITNTNPALNNTISGTVTVGNTLTVLGDAAASVTFNQFPAASISIASGKAVALSAGTTAATFSSSLSGQGKLQTSASNMTTGSGVTFASVAGLTGTGYTTSDSTAGLSMYLSGSAGYSNGIYTLTDMPSQISVTAAATAAVTGTVLFTGNSPPSYSGTQVVLLCTNNTSLSTSNYTIKANQGTGALVLGSVVRDGTVTGTFPFRLGGTNSEDNTISGTISEAAGSKFLSLTKIEAGTWVLSGTNTYTGNTRPVAGTLKIANALALQNSPLQLESGDTGTISFTGAAATAATVAGLTQTTTARDWQLPAGVTLTLGGTGSYPYGGNLTRGAGASIVKTGAGDQMFTAACGYDGTLTVNAGRMFVGNSTTTGALDSVTEVNIGASGGYYYSRTNAVTHPATALIKGTGTFGNWATGTLTVSAGALAQFAGGLYSNAATSALVTAEATDISLTSYNGAAATWTKNGAGKITFSSASSHAGSWNINAGEVAVNGTLATGGTLTVASGAKLTGTGAISKAVTINAGSTGNDFTVGGASALSISGTATVAGAAGTTRTVTVNAGGTATLSGVFSTLSALGGTTTTTAAFTGSSQTLRGTVTVNGGSIANNAGDLNIGPAAETTRVYLTSGTVQTIGSTNFYTAGNASALVALYQTGGTVYGSDTSSTGNLQALGWGYTSTALATPYTYHSNTGGTVQTVAHANGGWALWGQTVVDFGNNSTMNIPSGRLIMGRGVSGNAIVNCLGTGSTLTTAFLRMSWHSAPITGSSVVALTVDNSTYAAGALEFTTNTSATQAVNVLSAGRIDFSTTTATTTFGSRAINLQGGTLGVTGLMTLNFPIRLFGTGNRLSGGTGSSGVIAGVIENATGSGVSSVAITSGGTGYVGAPIVHFTGGGGAGATARCVFDAVTGTITSIVVTCPGVGYTSAPTINFSGGGGVVPVCTVNIATNSTTGAVEKIESGTLTLAGTNTYTGATTISAGTLSIGNGGATGTLGNSNASNAIIKTGAILSFNHTDSRTYAGIFSDAGSISKAQTSTVTLTGDNSFQGTASITAGVLVAAHSNALGTGTTLGVTVSNGAALHLSGGITTVAKPLTLNGTGITTTGALRNLSGNNTYAGPIALTLATRINSDADTLTLSNTTAISGATFGLTFGGAGNVALAAPIQTTSGTVAKDGAGTAQLSATTSNYTGTTTVTAGTLEFASIANVLGGASSLGAPTTVANGTVALSSGATLRFIGSGTSSTTRVINLVGGAGSTFGIESSGTAAVTYATAFTHGTSAVTRTLALGGSGTASNKLSFIIANNGAGGTVSISKSGSGKWVLNSANTFTGNVTISDGTLVAESEDASKRFGLTNLVTTSSTGKIQTLKGTNQNGRHTYNNLTLNGGRIRIGG